MQMQKANKASACVRCSGQLDAQVMHFANGKRSSQVTSYDDLWPQTQNEQIESTSMSWEVSMWASLGFSFADLLCELQDLSEWDPGPWSLNRSMHAPQESKGFFLRCFGHMEHTYGLVQAPQGMNLR